MGAEARAARSIDPADTVARVATAKREVLLRVYRRRLRREDLEDCYSQATLELLARARRGTPFESPQHISNALEQKFASRINDRHRAAGGRSSTEAALAGAVSLSDKDSGTVEVSDHAPSVAERVLLRQELRRLREVAGELTPDQRLVLFCQVTLDMDSAQFCARYGWSGEKYRKVAQRARAKLRTLTRDYDSGERCRQLEGDLLAYGARVADDPQAQRVRAHLENCEACGARLRELERAARQVAALLPVPVTLKAGLLAAAFGAARTGKHPLALLARSRPLGGRPHLLPEGAGAAGGAGGAAAGGAVSGAGSSLLGAGAAKLGVVVVCLAGAAGGLAVCRHEGWLPWTPGGLHPAHSHARLEARRRRLRPTRRAATSTPIPPVTGIAAPPATERAGRFGGRGTSVGAIERRLPSVQREFGVAAGARSVIRRLRRRRMRSRAARAGLARAGSPSAGAAAPRRAPRPGGGGGDFPSAGRASRHSARHEFGF